MADYGFATANLLSSSTSTFQVTFSSAQSGVIFISSSPISAGAGGSFTFPSGATYYYFSSQSTWCINVDLSKYYVGVIVYNASPNIDLTIQVDGQTLSISSTGTVGSAGATSNITLSDGLELDALSCCGFENPSVGSTTIVLGNANSCSGITSCSGCPTSGGTSSLVCSSSSTTTPPPSSTQNEAFYVVLSSTSTSSPVPIGNEPFYVVLPKTGTPTTNEAFYVSSSKPPVPIGNEAFYVTLPKSTTPTANEAFYVKPVSISIPVSNEAFYVQSVIVSPRVQNEAFYVIQFKQTIVHVTIPEYARFLSIVQAIYNVINLNVTASTNISQLSFIPVEVQISPIISFSIQQTSAPVTQTYEEQVFESFMAIPALYFLTKYGIKLIKRFRSKGEKK